MKKKPAAEIRDLKSRLDEAFRDTLGAYGLLVGVAGAAAVGAPVLLAAAIAGIISFIGGAIEDSSDAHQVIAELNPRLASLKNSLGEVIQKHELPDKWIFYEPIIGMKGTIECQMSYAGCILMNITVRYKSKNFTRQANISDKVYFDVVCVSDGSSTNDIKLSTSNTDDLVRFIENFVSGNVEMLKKYANEPVYNHFGKNKVRDEFK